MNIDKHRRLLLATSTVTGGSVRFGPNFTPSEAPLEGDPWPLKPGSQVCAFGKSPKAPEVAFDAELTTTVSLAEDEPPTPLVPLFQSLLARVRDEVVPVFDALR